MIVGKMFRALTQLFSLSEHRATLLTTSRFGGEPKNHMKLTQKITLVLALLAAAGTGIAQTAAGRGTGLLGQRFVDVGVGLQDIDNFSDHIYSAGASVNTPFLPSLADASFGYTYSRIKGVIRGNANTFSTGLKFYAPLQGVKPFVGANVGWQWVSIRGFDTEDDGIWGATAGVEIPVGAFTLTPRIVYSDDFESTRNSSQEWSYELEANYWFNASSAVYASVARSDGRSGSADSWNYRAGLRVKF